MSADKEEQVEMAAGNLKSVIYQPSSSKTATTPPSLKVLDQLLLPREKMYLDVTNVSDAWSVIHKMQIRGAPLIAIVAVLGLAVDLQSDKTKQDIEQMEQVHGSDRLVAPLLAYIQGKMDYLATSRPTAVNLFNALKEVKDILQTVATEQNDHLVSSPSERMVEAVIQHAEFMLQRDEADCRAIGVFGAAAVLAAKPDHEMVTIMTICNTGSLATAAYGTALGVVRSIHEQGRLASIVALETRPYNQGSRLTAFELVEDHLTGAKLICDSMAAYYMAKHVVSACIVGADRVAANGDTANKIGTYSLAVVALAHQVPFYVAAPLTTIDLGITDGSMIPIEERPARELLTTSLAPETIAVWNPAFDVTPAKWITGGIITEKGVIRPDANGNLDVLGFVCKHSKC